MNILVIVHVQTNYGGYTNILDFCKMLVQFGHKVTYVSTSNTNRFRINSYQISGVQIIEAPDWLWGKLRNGADPFNALIRSLYLLKHHFDFIYAIDSRPTVIIPALMLKYLKRIPMVQEWHDSYGNGGTIKERSSKLYANTVGHVETFFEKFFRKYADYGIAATTFLQQRLINLGFSSSKILLQRIGSTNKDYKILSKKEARRNLELSTEGIYLGYLGGIYKNDAEFLFHSIENLLQKNLDIKLLLIGRHRLSPDLTSNRSYLTLTGEISEETVLEYLQACDGLLLPFKSSIANKARWPSKVNHYMLSARPIISTPVSDFEEIFQQHNIGLISKDDSLEAYSDTLIQFIKSKDDWKRFGENGRNYFNEYLDYTVIIRRLLDFLAFN